MKKPVAFATGFFMMYNIIIIDNREKMSSKQSAEQE